jgi:hypothetical protein
MVLFKKTMQWRLGDKRHLASPVEAVVIGVLSRDGQPFPSGQIFC